MRLICELCGKEKDENDLIVSNNTIKCCDGFCVEKKEFLKENDVYNMDCLEGLKLIKTESVDLVLTDPPYNVKYNMKSMALEKLLKGSRQKQIERDKHYMKIGESEGTIDFNKLCKQLFRVLKDNTHCYIFCSTPQIVEIVPSMIKAGFNPSWQLLIWYKNAPSFDITIEHKYAEIKENILFFHKGWKRLNHSNNHIASSVLKYNKLTKCELHPTEKPQDLLMFLIKMSSKVGDLVLDCFAGSGAHLIASKRLNRRFIGFELSKEYYRRIKDRLAKEYTQKDILGYI